MTDFLIPGLESPGPIYQMNSCFDRAKSKSKHPTWGPSTQISLKQGRFRDDEVRFTSARHMRDMLGHFSPGPQYGLPGAVGGAHGNEKASAARLASQTPLARTLNLDAAAMPYPSVYAATGRGGKLTAADLGATEQFNLTRGSHADPQRNGGTEEIEKSTDYWRTPTMLQLNEPNRYNAGPYPAVQQPWHMTPTMAGETQGQEDVKQALRERWRPTPKLPKRQVGDMRADPPLATVFGSTQAHEDFGGIGGMDRGWRESKVQGHSTCGPNWGKSTGALRYAFIQKTGPNSIPNGVAKVDFAGGRISYATTDGSMPRSSMPDGTMLLTPSSPEASVR